jgi:protease-4
MNITPEYLIERQRNKSQLAKWKTATIISISLLSLFFMKGVIPFQRNNDISRDAKSANGSDYIASIKIQDVIFEDQHRITKLTQIEKNNSIKAVIVNINSQGGSVVGSEMLYNALLKISKVKPVVVVMESVAASGGYMASLAGDYIIAHNGTITGSIGVIMQSAEITELAEKAGIKLMNFKSGDLKAAPNLTEKLTPEAKQATMDSVYDVYDYFVGLVAKRRNLDLNYVKTIADGRIYSASKALKLKLIDAIGNEDTAVDWLREKKNISKDLELVEVSLAPKDKLLDILMGDFQNRIFTFFSSSFNGLKSII